MKRKLTAVALIPMLLLLTACPQQSRIDGYIDLAVMASVNGLRLAQSFGANVSNDLITQVQRDGSDLKNAYDAWAVNQTTDKWTNVQNALDVFEKNLPQFLADAHITNPLYQSIAEAAVQAINFVVSLIRSQNPVVTGVKKAGKPLNEAKFKKDYNQNMVKAGHPELELK